MPNWTPQQNNAITARNRNILVSAAAGSGKTAVLVERVIGIITDTDNPVDIDKLLIVTFTNAAAAEMKYRISKALNTIVSQQPENKHIQKQLSLLPNAKICTIDSFCSNIVKENFYNLSISQDFTMLDESEVQILEDSVISDVIDNFFEQNDTDFISLIESFTTPDNDRYITEAVKKLLSFIYAQPFPYYWLDNMAQLYNPEVEFNQTVWYEYIKNELEYLFDFGISLVKENISLIDFDDAKINDKFLTAMEDDLTEFTRFKNAFDISWDSLINEREASFVRMPSSQKADKAICEKLKSNRNIYKKILCEDIPSFFSSTEEEYSQNMQILYPQLKALSKLVKETDLRLIEEKRERNAFSFSDIEHFAINLLFEMADNGEIIKTELAQELSSQYYEILVDEYQDTNEAQDMLFTYLSNGQNLFTVGDIKQSIYRFRLAMPHIFNLKKKSYTAYDPSDSEKSSKIILDKNFRSRKDICSYVNFIFSNIMTEKVGELDYNSDEYLNYGADYADSDIPSAQVKILTGVKGEDRDKKEAALIAKMIIDKVNSGELIKDGEGYRPIRYGDFAILMRSVKNHINEYSEVLTQYSIPVICDNSSNLFENNEIKILMSFLRVIDNPQQDIPLLSTMMSPIYGFTADELTDIKLGSSGSCFYETVFNSTDNKVRAFIDDIRNLRKISVTMSVAGFIRYLIETKSIVSYANAMGNGEQRYQNIIKFISFAQNFDKGVSVGLTSFVRYIDKIIESDKKTDSASINSSGDDAVTIMSVHHSKGLEFPVCILAGASRQYNKSDLNDKLLLNTALGIGIKCHDENMMCQFQSIPYSVIKDRNTFEIMSENLRVLYVALTRAKEQFITVISLDKLDKKIEKLSANIIKNQITPYICKKVNSDADFILLCSLIHPDGKILREYSSFEPSVKNADFKLEITVTDDIELESTQECTQFVPYDNDIVSQIGEKLSFVYNREELSSLSSKLTASSLDDPENSFEYLTSSKPAFLNKKGLTPAQRGSAMHMFMQFCDYQSAKDDLEKEIARLSDNGFITFEEAQSLDRKMLCEFFNGEFASRMFKSDKIYREIKVSSFVSANELYDTDFGDKVLIQGISDCVFEENGELILVDYKTDRVNSADELLDRYKNQIGFYRMAVSKTLQKPVKEAVLYSFHLGRVCYYK
ncbi:MAG: helicase-exonuclease AddAB subunit AddA [Eubacterium sp.]